FTELAAECGLGSFIIMAGALDGKKIRSELLSYEGPFGVGYVLASFYISGKDENRHFDEIYIKNELAKVESIKEQEDEYVQLARQTLENYIINNKVINKPDNISKELKDNRSGVFVTLNLDGKLRGCIGTISPTTD